MGFVRSAQADSDLDSIWYYIATESGSIEIADRLVDTITERFFLLAQYPHMGRRRDDDLRPGVRSFPVEKYVIFYQVQDAGVFILRVLHGSRDIEPLF